MGLSKLTVADVASFAITEFPGFGTTITPVSNPNVLVLLGFLLFTGKALSCVTELLKKLPAKRSAVDILTLLINKRSFANGYPLPMRQKQNWLSQGLGLALF